MKTVSRRYRQVGRRGRVTTEILKPPIVTAETEDDLIRLALSLGAEGTGGELSPAEQHLVSSASAPERVVSVSMSAAVREAIIQGKDPLGDCFYRLRLAAVRRQTGAVFTPRELITPMLEWVLPERPRRMVDAGSGSGRFSVAAARLDPTLLIVAVDVDPVASILTRAALSAMGHKRCVVMNADYTRCALPASDERTAFIGNPPYVRHHDLAPATKAWAQAAARELGHRVSGLAGLHAYFFLATALKANRGDVGCFVTSSEWLDVNYGAVIRELLLNALGGTSIDVLEPTALPFGKTATTAAITCFRVGERPPSVRLRQLKSMRELKRLSEGEPVARERLLDTRRWTPLMRATRRLPDGYVELGELCRVHRGAVTGANSTWVTSQGMVDLPEEVLFRSVTRARELFEAGDTLTSVEHLRCVIDLPEDLDVLALEDRRRVERFLQQAMRLGAADGYIARYRRRWWSVGLREAAPILTTYMARRAPAFVRNAAKARHINIAHGIYPRAPLPDYALHRITEALRRYTTVIDGRTYAGGLTKFEPREVERLPVPDLAALLAPCP
jgi:predicted RNA methylase